MGRHDEDEKLLADELACDDSERAFSPSLAPEPPVARYRPPEPERSDIDIRREMQERLSAFRNYQRLQTLARDVYYEQALQRIRAVTEQWA